MGIKRYTGLTRIIKAGENSAQGIRSAWRSEAAFRQEVVLVAALLPIAIALGQTGLERALLIGSLLLVLVVELLNSGLEALCDQVSTDHHPLIGRAKDMGSAAVLFALLNVGICFALIAYDRWT